MATSIVPGVTAAPPPVERPAVPAESRSLASRDARAPEVEVESVLSTLQETGREFVFGDRTIEFTYDETIGRIIVKVMSESSGEVVRQIPPEDYIRFASRLREQLGVLFDEVY